ncbi:MAG: hypothetical protein ACQEXJ_22195 [Myxococcota bacterium]
MNLEGMSTTTRKNLVQMACVAAWSDLSVAEAERRAILDLAMRLALDDEDLAEVRTWLDAPPPEFDPNDIPEAHRKTFVDALEDVVKADGRLDADECITLGIIRELVGDEEPDRVC